MRGSQEMSPLPHPSQGTEPPGAWATWFSHVQDLLGRRGVCVALRSWVLRAQVMPCLEAVALVLLILLVPDPPRGAAEKQEEVATGGPRSSWWEDVRYLGRK